MSEDIDPTLPTTAYVRNIWAVREGPCRPRYIRVIIHPDAESLNAAANRYDKRRGMKASHYEAAGMFQPIGVRSEYDRSARKWVDTTPAFAGIMRLANGYLTAEIVTHESVHAALTIWRMHDWSKDGGEGVANLGDNGGPIEEDFAHLVSGIADQVNDIVWRYLRGTRRQPEKEVAA